MLADADRETSPLMLIGAEWTWEQSQFDTEPSTTTMAIEKVSLGSPVPDQNPRPEDYDDSLGEVDPATVPTILVPKVGHTIKGPNGTWNSL
jgi:hypothetical protein